MRASDLLRIPQEVIALYEDEPPTSGDLVFQPPDLSEPDSVVQHRQSGG